MSQPNPFDQFDGAAQPVPVTQIRPILTDPNKAAEAEMKAREEQRDITRLGVTLEGEERAVSKEQFDRITTFRKEFLTEPLVREFRGVQNATNQIVELAKRENDQPGPGDIALIISFMKALDPGSVVRETEFATAENAGGVPETVRNAYNKLLSGGRLTPEIKKEFARTAASFYNSRLTGYNAFAEDYRGLVAAEGADPDKQGIRLAEPIQFEDDLPDTTVGGTGETFLTPEDQELQGRLQSAYQSGASLGELQAISAEYNRTFPIATQEELDAARQQGRSLNVQPSGVRSEAAQMLGAAAESPVGAYAVGAANALLSGGMDELAPILGLDANTVQAAKEMLRERYPVSSFAGEVTGQGLQLAGAGAALRGAGMGARVGAAEIAQGAAYGAGESNENRLAGAAIGGGAAVVGQQIARRLLDPAAQAAVQKVADDAGVPREAIEEVLGEAAAMPPSAAPIDEAAQTEIGTIARQALGRGSDAKKAREKLAVMAQVNPEAKAAAERLGMELPADILSDDARLLTVTGLARSQIGSEAQTAWGQTVNRTIQQADQTLQEIGASPDLAQVGADVMDRLQQNIDSLERSGAALRREVDDAIDVRDRVEAVNLQSAMADVINDMGGLADAKQAFSAEERKLFDMLGEGETANAPTYARLNQMRDQIGKALFKGQGPWADTAQANLAKYYAALADDQLGYVESVGGKELADKMRGSNDLFKKMYDARRSMQSVYGQQLERDLPPLINRAITKAQRGDAQDLRKLMDGVPEDMRPQVLLSGIMNAAQRKSAQGGFSFAQYAKMYSGLRKNAPIYKQIADTVGPEGARVMQDLFAVSRRMAAAEDKIVRTGASNQPLINALNVEGLVGRFVGSAGRVGSRAAGATAGATVGGPLGASAGYEIGSAIETAVSRGSKSNLDKLHGLLSSDAFKGLVEKVAQGGETRPAINRLVGDKTYRNFAAKVLRIKTPEQRRAWLENAIKGGAVAGATTQTRPEAQPTSTIEVR